MILWLALACPPPIPAPPPTDSPDPGDDSEAPAAPAPTIVGVQPSQLGVSGGELIVISGANFSADAEVYLGEQKVPIAAFDPSSLAILAPSAAEPGTAELRVVQASGEAKLPEAIRYFKEWGGASIAFLWGHFRINRPERMHWLDYQMGWIFAFTEPFVVDPWLVEYGTDAPDVCTLTSPLDTLDFTESKLPAYAEVALAGESWRIPNIGNHLNRVDRDLPEGPFSGPVLLSSPGSVDFPALAAVEVAQLPEAPLVTSPADLSAVTLGADGLTVAWTPQSGTPLHLRLESDAGTVRCYVEDDGAFTVAPDLVESLLDPDLEATPFFLELGSTNISEVDYPTADAKIATVLQVATVLDITIAGGTP